MIEKKPNFQSYEALISRISALESQIQYANQQLSKLKPINFLKKRNLNKSKKEDLESIKTLYDKTPFITITDAIECAENELSSPKRQKT